ncbi:MAG: phytanoyl-CoA dioxygenase family protein [Pseudomonadota bacterium]
MHILRSSCEETPLLLLPPCQPTPRTTFATQGFVQLAGVLTASECADLADLATPREPIAQSAMGHSGGTRCLLARPWCAALAQRLRAHPALSALLPPQAVAVQCTYFEKTTERNWLVPLHQDLSIPVAARVSSPALHGWAEKEGELFVQPPPEVLAELVAVRLHLDPCDAEDGALRVVPGSHRQGVLLPVRARALRDGVGEVACRAAVGAALVMRPLLLHASSKSTGSRRRRVLHFVFGPASLPLGLRWARTA